MNKGSLKVQNCIPHPLSGKKSSVDSRISNDTCRYPSQWASGCCTCLSGFFTCHGGCCTYFHDFGEHYICFAGWYTFYREIFSHFIFAPFVFAVSGQALDWVNSIVSNYLSFNTGEFKMGRYCLQLQKNFLKNHMEWKQPCI